MYSSFGLGLTILLVILGRALSAPLWDMPASAATGAGGVSSLSSEGMLESIDDADCAVVCAPRISTEWQLPRQ